MNNDIYNPENWTAVANADDAGTIQTQEKLESTGYLPADTPEVNIEDFEPVPKDFKPEPEPTSLNSFIAGSIWDAAVEFGTKIIMPEDSFDRFIKPEEQEKFREVLAEAKDITKRLPESLAQVTSQRIDELSDMSIKRIAKGIGQPIARTVEGMGGMSQILSESFTRIMRDNPNFAATLRTTMDLAPGMAGVIGASEKLTEIFAKNSLGEALAHFAGDVADEMVVDDPHIFDKFLNGIGYAATFIGTGTGVAGVGKLLGMAPKVASMLSLTTATYLESSLEGYFAHQDALATGLYTEEEAQNVALRVFSMNGVLNAFLNKFEMFFVPDARGTKAVMKTMVAEPAQEFLQKVVSDTQVHGKIDLAAATEEGIYAFFSTAVMGMASHVSRSYRQTRVRLMGLDKLVQDQITLVNETPIKTLSEGEAGVEITAEHKTDVVQMILKQKEIIAENIKKQGKAEALGKEVVPLKPKIEAKGLKEIKQKKEEIKGRKTKLAKETKIIEAGIEHLEVEISERIREGKPTKKLENQRAKLDAKLDTILDEQVELEFTPEEQIEIAKSKDVEVKAQVLQKARTRVVKERLTTYQKGFKEGKVTSIKEFKNILKDMNRLVKESSLKGTQKAQMIKAMQQIKTVDQFNKKIGAFQDRITQLETQVKKRELISDFKKLTDPKAIAKFHPEWKKELLKITDEFT